MIRFSMSDDMVSNEVEVSGLRRDASIPFTQQGFMYPLLFLRSKAYRVSSSSICRHMPYPNGQSSTIYTMGVSQRSV